MFCKECGNKISENAAICMKCGVPTDQYPQISLAKKSRLVYIMLGFFLGALGIHNFYAGYNGTGIAQLLITIFLGWLFIPLIIVWIWVLVEICVVNKDAQGQQFI